MKTLLSFIMAIIMALAFATMPTNKASAQLVTSVSQSDTLTNADTVVLSHGSVADGVKGFQTNFTRISGTAAGKIWLEGSIDNTNWVYVDTTFTMSNAATVSKVFAITSNNYRSYRVRFITSGTVTGTCRSYLLRRKD